MIDSPNKHKLFLLGLSNSQLEEFAVSHGESSFRGRQLYDWIYNKGVQKIDNITVLLT